MVNLQTAHIAIVSNSCVCTSVHLLVDTENTTSAQVARDNHMVSSRVLLLVFVCQCIDTNVGLHELDLH